MVLVLVLVVIFVVVLVLMVLVVKEVVLKVVPSLSVCLSVRLICVFVCGCESAVTPAFCLHRGCMYVSVCSGHYTRSSSAGVAVGQLQHEVPGGFRHRTSLSGPSLRRTDGPGLAIRHGAQ